ncbi:MAG TPA: lipid A deacylase LpxR family protein, partial [Verrucomicrobiae bacterium]|nr:lipid A deacylase LpxR family protein [Verrucomicrobiae bacterium]
SVPALFAADDEALTQEGFISLTDEDDAFAYPWLPHTDRHYTHGIRFSGMSAFESSTNPPAYLRILGWNGENEAHSVGAVFGQNMYTPTDILDPNPIPSDRPYAGWLYAGPVYQREGRLAPNLYLMDSFAADFGMVGPDSLAGATQKEFHRIFFPDDVPAGWHNQVRNEPGLVLKFERTLRWSPTAATARFVDVLPRAGLELGNVFTFATAGVTARVGFNLPPDFGEAPIDSAGSVNSGLTRHSPWFSFYGFAGVDGRAVLQNITLDGSWFQGDPSVSKYTWVGDLDYGFAFQFNPHTRYAPQLEISFTHIERSLEFHGQNGNDIFAGVTLKANWHFW